jgi:hypothetical protein
VDMESCMSRWVGRNSQDSRHAELLLSLVAALAGWLHQKSLQSNLAFRISCL